MLTLLEAARLGLERETLTAAGERTEQVVLQKDDLRVLAAHDGRNVRRAKHAPYRAIDDVERLEDDVAGIQADRCGLGEHAGELTARAAPERARGWVRIVDHEHAAEAHEARQPAHL